MVAVDLAQEVPGLAAVEKILQGNRPAGQQLGRHGLERRHRLGRMGAAGGQGGQEVLDQGRALRIARAFQGLQLRAALHVFVQEVLLEMHHVVGQGIAEGAVVLALAAQEDDGKAVLRVGADDLVDPAGDAPAHVGKGAFQQQGDVGIAGLGGRHHWPFQ